MSSKFKLSTLLCLFSLCSSVMVGQSKSDADLAEAFFQSQNFDQAAIRYQKLADQYPSSNFYLFRLCVSLYESRQYDQAIFILSKKLDQRDDKDPLLLTLMQCHFAKKDFKNGEEVLEKLLSSAKSIEKYVSILNALKKERLHDRIPKVVLDARRKFRESNQNANSLFADDLAESFLFLNRYQDATIEYLKQLGMDAPDFQRIRAQISSYAQKSNPIELKQTIKTIENEQSNYQGVARQLLSQILLGLYMESSDFESAYREALYREKVLNAGGTHLLSFGQSALAEKAFAPAKKAFQSAIAMNQNSFAVQMGKLGLARVLESESRSATNKQPELIKESILAYEDYVSSYPQSNEASFALLQIASLEYELIKDLASAKKTISKLLNFYPNSPHSREAELLLAKIYIEEDNLNEAELTVKSALNRPVVSNEFTSNGLFLMGSIAYYKTNFSEALAHFAEIESPREASNDALLRKLLILKGIGDSLKNKSALDALARFAQIEKLLAQQKISIGYQSIIKWLSDFDKSILIDDVLFKKGELEEAMTPTDAIVTYEKIVTLYPKSYYADKSLFRLGKLNEGVLKNRIKAIECYETLLKTYPRSFLSKLAREEIRRLKQPS